MVIKLFSITQKKTAHSVYLVLLDAYKAFDRVSSEKLFNVLLKRNMCPRIGGLLLYIHVKWNN